MARKQAGGPEASKPRRSRPGWKARFLDALARTGLVVAAAQAAAVSRSTAYSERLVDPEFSQGWELALQAALAVAEEVLYERAISGADTTALIFLLKCRKAEVYGDKRHLRLSGQVAVKKADELTDDELAAVVLAGAAGSGDDGPR